MFESLTASCSATPRPRLPWFASLLLHLALIGGGIVATREIAIASRTTSATSAPLVFTAPVDPAAATSTPEGVPAPRPSAPDAAFHPPLALPSIRITVDAVQHPEPAGGDRTTPRRAPPGGVPMLQLPVLRGSPGDEALAVDDPAVPLAGPRPAYPPGRRAAGIEGSVRLRFVVTATGTIDTLSVRLLAASDTAFVGPAITAILAWRFAPARRRGAPVAQQVEQVVRFRLEH